MLSEKAVRKLIESESASIPWNIYMENVDFYFHANEVTNEKKKRKTYF